MVCQRNNFKLDSLSLQRLDLSLPVVRQGINYARIHFKQRFCFEFLYELANLLFFRFVGGFLRAAQVINVCITKFWFLLWSIEGVTYSKHLSFLSINSSIWNSMRTAKKVLITPGPNWKRLVLKKYAWLLEGLHREHTA